MRLKKEQEDLKFQLLEAKSRINVGSNRWSYDLHTADSGLDHMDPDFLEALQKETSILGKRVAACQARTLVSTSFQSTDNENKEYVGCTADCTSVLDLTDVASMC